MPVIQHPLAISSVTDETPSDRTFAFAIPPGAEKEFRFVPGQFITVVDDPIDGQPPRKHAYSISSSPDEAGHVAVTVRDMGHFGARFYRYPVGKVLQVISPRGAFTLDPIVTDDLLLIAGGSGVTPFRGFVRYLRSVGHAKPVTVLYSARRPEDLIFDAEFRRHAREAPGFRYVPTVTRLDPSIPFDGLRGRVTEEMLRSLVRDPNSTTCYVCGPNAFVDAALALAERLGIPKDRRRKEKWG